jgi:uncharacterized protein
MPDFGKALKQLRAEERQPYLTGLSPVSRLSLSTQLQFLKSHRMTTYVPIETSARTAIPPGEVHSNDFGSHYVVRKTYPDGYYHGKVQLGRFSTIDLRRLMQMMKHRATAGDRDRILFLDTETTGVQGGTGICPFLVGVGYFSGDDFHVVQYFIRDFDEEPSMLESIGQMVGNFDLVITYNGATFDIPLLETRFTLARLDNPFEHIGHFDFLNTARRLWRNGHGSCRLTALERLLSFMRGPDVPGAMIPRLYFDFLQQRPAPELPRVFTHNVHDVVSLAALTIHACDCIAAEPAALDEPLDLYSLARILENTADWPRASKFYEMAIVGGLPEPTRVKALENLSIIYRRTGDHERAFRISQELMGSGVFSLVAYEGAAIYHERIAGNMEAALHVIQQGLQRLGASPHGKRWRTLLQSRWNRLQQKVIGFPAAQPIRSSEIA